MSKKTREYLQPILRVSVDKPKAYINKVLKVFATVMSVTQALGRLRAAYGRKHLRTRVSDFAGSALRYTNLDANTSR